MKDRIEKKEALGGSSQGYFFMQLDQGVEFQADWAGLMAISTKKHYGR